MSRLVAALAVAFGLAPVAGLLVLAGGGANASPTSAVCGGAGSGQTINGVTLNAEQMGNALMIVTATAARWLPVYAAVVAVTTAYTESGLHNTTVETDHDSEGLFQQRVSIYTKPVADDPVKATTAFIDRLLHIPGWRSTPVGFDAQAVQHSQYPDRYQPNVRAGNCDREPALAHRRCRSRTHRQHEFPADGRDQYAVTY